MSARMRTPRNPPCWWRCKMVRPLQNRLAVLPKMTLWASRSPFWVYTWREPSQGTWTDYLHTPILSIVHERQQVGTMQVSIRRWMPKQNVVCAWNGMLLSAQKEGSSHTCYSLGQRERTTPVWFYYNEIPTIVQLLETESRTVAVSGWQRGEIHTDSAGEDEKVLERGGRDAWMTVWLHFTPLSYTLCNGQNGKCRVMHVYQKAFQVLLFKGF